MAARGDYFLQLQEHKEESIVSKMTLKMASFMVVALMMLAGILIFVPSADAKPVDDLDGRSRAVLEPNAMTLAQEDLKTMMTGGLDLDEGVDVVASTIGADETATSDPIYTNKTYIAANLYTGNYHLVSVMKMGEGEHCEVWVGKNLYFPTGDPRNVYTSRFNISTDQVNYIMNEFDNNIYPKMSDFFGVPGDRNGSAAMLAEYFGPGWDYFNNTDGGKVMIVIYNIRDENYYYPTYPYYVVGYFSSTLSDAYDRNIIHIDMWDWANRTGEQPSNPARSYLYEATVAHEYQHLLHNWYDPQEESFVNEGCSDYAELVCGYGEMSLASHIGNFLDEPSNSLTVWGDGDQLADYGAAALFTIYLNDKFGGAETIQALVKNTKTGIAGIEDTLAARGYGDWTFNKVFKAWRLTNLIDGNQPGNGMYKYDTLSLADMGALFMISHDMNSGTFNRNDDMGGEIGEYGTDYIQTHRGFMRTRERFNTYMTFWGDQYDYEAGWQNFGSYWWSNQGDQMDNSLQGTIDLTGTIGTIHELTILTRWDMEDYWDFGFVQVSTDGGKTWTSLENAYTTYDHDPNAMQSIVDNLPGITSYSPWQYVTWDLSAYDEQVIEVRFRYMTDWATSYSGWYIDDVYLDGYWIDNAGYEYVFSPVREQTDYLVTMVLYRNDLAIGIIDVPVDSLYDDGWYKPFKLRAVNSICTLISPTEGFVNYWYYVGNLEVA
ncbi:MAG: immune inhibitor A [Methanomassiliicoccales archaeon]|nr:MAG: immune inhibitor A [Methanomassiliicoccales archaeon]